MSKETIGKIVSGAVGVLLCAGGVVLLALDKSPEWAGRLIAGGLVVGGAGTMFLRGVLGSPKPPTAPVPDDGGES